eukprot:TRINITY_DN32_c0_g1_i3.p1 TRINITY_DN32_c0_g1~~TRINITY_DN32_c0_g1_i3.p1  ORF type:complete len:215 (-),score=-61.61 TRINITY_DN32_c0_g1_i3:89-733(-)
MVQQSAFATDVLPDLYAFHRYTRNSLCPYHTLAVQFPLPFRSQAPVFDSRLELPPADALRPIIPDNACILRLTAAAGTELADADSSGTVRLLSQLSSQRKGVYNPRAFFPHAVLLRQAFAHCGKFPTAASRRSLGRVSVPVWLIVLSDQLPIVALVGFYSANQLIGRELIFRLQIFSLSVHRGLAVVSNCCLRPEGRFSRVTHPSATKYPCTLR